MDAPNIIWLQRPNRDPENEWCGETTWCEDKQNDDDTCYIKTEHPSQSVTSEPFCYFAIDEDGDIEYNKTDRFSCGRSGGTPLYTSPQPCSRCAETSLFWMEKQAEAESKLAALEAENERLHYFPKNDVFRTAEVILSDCGCSTEHTTLLEKVRSRLFAMFDKTIAQQAERISQLEAENKALKELFTVDNEGRTMADQYLDAKTTIAQQAERIKELLNTIHTNTNRELTITNRFFRAVGEKIYDENFDFDAMLCVSGDFVEDEKARYALMISCTLNQFQQQAETIQRQAAVIDLCEKALEIAEELFEGGLLNKPHLVAPATITRREALAVIKAEKEQL